MTTLRAELLARLRALVEARRLSARQVALRAGLSVRTVRRLLRGETMLLETLEQVERALRADLLRRSETGPEAPIEQPSPSDPHA